MNSTHSAGRKGSAFDLFNVPDDYFAAPQRYFKELRESDPIHENSDGSVLVTRYADVKAVWLDPTSSVDKSELFAAKFGPGPLLEHHTSSMLFRDEPDHMRLRSIINPFFTPTSINRLRTDIEKIVERLLDEAAERREFDFLHEFAFRIPTAVISRILGVPETDGEQLHQWGSGVIIPLNPGVGRDTIAHGHRSAEAFKEYILGHVAEMRKRPAIDPTEGIMCALVAAQRAGHELSDAEIAHMCILMFNGGHATTTHLLGLSLNALLDHPDQLDRWRGDTEISPTAIEECIRYGSPLQYQGRRTTQALSLPSGTLPANTEIVVCQASANRDETVFADPDRLDLGRRPNAHLAFGSGIHFCIGRPLARLEMDVTMPRFIRRFRTIERTKPVEFNKTPRFRGLAELQIRVG